jgi:hypothetical protein
LIQTVDEAVKRLFSGTEFWNAAVRHFGWAIHVTPVSNVEMIRTHGLTPNSDGRIPDDLKEHVPSRAVTCLHPMGAKLCPGPVCRSADQDTQLMTLAIHVTDLPPIIHPDWSYSWDYQRSMIGGQLPADLNQIARYLLVEHGSMVTYNPMPAANLRVFIEGMPPANPMAWPMLSVSHQRAIATHRKGGGW